MMGQGLKLYISVKITVDPPSREQMRAWGQNGAARFNDEATRDGLETACETATGNLVKANEILANDRASK